MFYFDQLNIRNALTKLIEVCSPGQAGGFVSFEM